MRKFFVFLLSVLPLAAAPNFTVILGQPTDRSITVNVRSDTSVELYFQYGTASGVYTGQTAAATVSADPYASGYYVTQSVIAGLTADTRYYYRMQYRLAGSTAIFTAGVENTFHTQRQPGSSFVFCIQGDSHPERANTMFNSNLYIQTLTAVAAEQPDFYITSGDDFSVDTLPTPYTQSAVTGRYTLQLPYLNIVSQNSALFLGTGNHEQTSLWNYNLPADNKNSNQVPIWAQNARNLYYPVPGPNDAITGTFYTGNTTTLPNINGNLRDYYAWTWGDALFVVIDPYWASAAEVDAPLGGGANSPNPTESLPNGLWNVTHGDAQYDWLKQTLQASKAKWKFVFAHHVMGTQRGGIEVAPLYEWGGENKNGTPGFATFRPTWPEPIHQLFVQNNVTIFFQAHDHLFVHQQLDGVTYQELPNPADNTYTAFNADAYLSGDLFPNAGYTKVTVGPASVSVQYIREWLPQDETPTQVSGTVQFAYTIPSSGSSSGTPSPTISSVANAAGEAPLIAPNTWVEIKGANLAPAGDSRSWTASDFVNNQLPTQLDGVGAKMNGKAAYVSYISPSQINILTPPDAISGSVPVQVTANGLTSSTFTAQAQASSPSFFLFNGGAYVAATHADGSLLGPTTLYPGASTPAKPGETVVLYANGFGSTSTAVVSGSELQSGSLSPLPVIAIGGTAASVQFAGLVSPGLFQFNVTVPTGTPVGDQPVLATYNGQSTQTGNLLSVSQ